MTGNEIITSSENGEFLPHLISCNVEFVVVGGIAVAFYGCRDNADVDDLDIMLRPTPANFRKFFKAARSFGMTTPWVLKKLARPSTHISIKSFLHIDILTPPAEYDFQNLLDTSNLMVLNGVAVRVVSKENLIKLKDDTVESHFKAYKKHNSDLQKLLGA